MLLLRTIRLASVWALTLVGCSSGVAGTTGVEGTSDGGARDASLQLDASVGPSPDASTWVDPGEKCSSTEQLGGPVPEVEGALSPVSTRGGTIQDGTYVLVSAHGRYENPTPIGVTLEFRGAKVYAVVDYEGSETRESGTVRTGQDGKIDVSARCNFLGSASVTPAFLGTVNYYRVTPKGLNLMRIDSLYGDWTEYVFYRRN